MNKLLDTTFTFRRLLSWLKWGIPFIAATYLVSVFLYAWNMKIGGVTLNNSPFVDQIPEKCRNFAERSFGTPANRTLIDEFLLRERLHRRRVEGLFNGGDLATACLGYAVLGGLHGKTAHDANFVEQWIDEFGDAVVTVSVEYNKPLANNLGSKK